MSIMHLDDEPVGTLHPLDLLERAVEANGWAFERAGRDELNLSVAGSGNADMADLLVDSAKVTIAGSGNVVFASDGKVKAHLMGSGMVTVRGAARCKVQSVGSGCLVCEPRDQSRKNKAG